MTELNKFQMEIEELLKRSDKATDRALYNLYAETIRDLKRSLLVDYQRLDSLTSSQKLKLSQMSTLLEQLDQSADKLKKGLRNEITGHLERTGKLAYNELFFEYDSKYTGINFAMLKEEELRTIIETPVANFKLSDRLNDGVVPDLQKNIKADLTRIFLHGASYQKAAARLAEVGYSSYRRAMNITRTEAGRVQAVARQKAQLEAEKLGIEFEKVWVATLDGRTRHNHQLLDGVSVNPDGYFEINGLKAKQPHMFGIASEDVNCRCRTISKLVDDLSNFDRRDGKGEVGNWSNYQEWEKSKLKAENPSEIVTNDSLQTVAYSDARVYNYIEGEDNIRKAIAEFGKITDVQRELVYSPWDGAYRGYVRTDNSFDINAALRPDGDIEALSDDDWATIGALTKVILANKTPYNIRGKRKVDFNWVSSFIADTDLPKSYPNMEKLSEALNSIKGHSYKEFAFSSISADPELNVFPSRRVWLDLEIPKGTKAYMTDNVDESEFILGVNTIFELKDSSIEKDQYGDLLKITLKIRREEK